MAEEVFLEEGFAAASMATIAARVGGSKGTLYNYFKNKDELFVAYVRRHCAWQKDAMFSLFADEPDVASALTHLGRNYLRIVLSDTNLTELPGHRRRGPAVARPGPAPSMKPAPDAARRLSWANIWKAMADKGLLDLDDPVQAAHEFIALCQNRLWKARLCNVAGEPTEAEIDHQVDPRRARLPRRLRAVRRRRS